MICWRSGRRLGRCAAGGRGTGDPPRNGSPKQVDWAESMHAGGVVSSRLRGAFSAGRAAPAGEGRRCCGRLPRPQPLPDRAPHRQRRLRRRLRGLGRAPRAPGRGQGDRHRRARPGGASCARRRPPPASTTPGSSPSTRSAKRTATRCWSPSWSTATPWPGSAAPATLSDREIGEIGADLCEALDHAHSRGVVHRDIKPQNVLVTEAASRTRS